MTDAVLRCVEREPEDLAPGECAFRRCQLPDGTIHWRLWFAVLDEQGDDAGTQKVISVAVAPGGPAAFPADEIRRTWAITRVAPGRWAWDVSPSIDAPDIWHHTPEIVDVPEPPPWER